MKKNVILIASVLLSVIAQAQNGLEQIVVETYYVSDEADSLDADENFAVYPLGIGSVTYRVYVDMLPGYKFIQLFGNQNHPLTIATTTAFYNDPNYGVSVYSGTSLNNTKKHTTLIDSYLTVGGVASGLMGVLKEEDTDGTIGNLQGILANNNPAAGQPIMGTDGVDGLMPGTPVLPNTLGISADLDVFDQTEGVLFTTSNGTIAALGGAPGVTETNHVLIGQFTTDGTFSFNLNVQLLAPDGSNEIYVWGSPVGNEILNETLTFESEPIVSSVIEKQSNGSLQLYPNPSSEFVWLVTKNLQGRSYQLINMTGQIIAQGMINSEMTQVDIDSISEGVYSIVIAGENGPISKLFIKK